jgi:hypothetical protein
VGAGAGLLALGVTVVILALGARSTAHDPETTVRVTAADALATVQRLVPDDHGLVVTGPEAGISYRFYLVESKDVHAAVDASTGVILSFTDTLLMPTSALVAISPEEALADATAYLATQGVSLDGLGPSTELLDHGDTKEYAVTWTGRVNGVRLPTLRRVSVDPGSGRVYGYSSFDKPWATPPAPRLTATEAEMAARRAINDAGATVTSTDLAITFDAGGSQLLVYELDLTTSNGFYAKVQVDAMTGTATVTGRG